MAYFDLTSATANAYRKTWHERRYLLRLAVMPVLVKLAFYILATSLTQGDDGTYMRFVLIMVPAFLAEGWMLSHYVRLIVLDHRWPFRPSGDFEKDMAILSVRARGILSGMIVYVLINMAVGLFVWGAMAYMMPYVPDGESGTSTEVPGGVAFLSVLILGFMFWAFRLIWLYIPYALNQDGASYLRALRGIGSSLHLIGIWLLCLLPFFVGLQITGAVLIKPLSMVLGDHAGSFLMIVVTVIIDTIKNIFCTAGITYAYMQLFEKNSLPGK